MDTAPNAAQSAFTATPATISADGIDDAALASTWKNAAGDPLAGKLVTYSMLDGTPDAGQSSLALSAASVAVGAEVTLTITLKNAAGVPIPYLPAAHIPVQVAGGTGNTLGTVTATDEDGIATVTFESSSAGTKTFSLTCGGVVLTPANITITGSVVFAMDYSSGAASLAGFTSVTTSGADFDITRQAAIGPSSQDGYRWLMNHVGPTGGDVGYGWGRTFTGAPFAYGDRVFFRFRYRWTSGTNGRSYEQDDSGALAGTFRNKFIILNDGSSSLTSRFILNCNIDHGSPGQFQWVMGKGGGNDPASTTLENLHSNWQAMQVEIQYSSAFGQADGAYRLWQDNATEGSPDAASVNITMYADANPGQVSLGAYVNNGVYSDGVIGYEICDFHIGDAFDSGWGA